MRAVLKNVAGPIFARGSQLGRAMSTGAIDVHTHMYLPSYMDVLRKRTEVPRVLTIGGEDRLVILPGEDDEITTSTGRPIGREYWDVKAKLEYMDKHNIQTSVVSLANPWLDFMEGQEAASVAQELNDELQHMCEQSNGRLLGMATLPVRNPKAAVKEIDRLGTLSHIRGIILGTPGAGDGLDHDNVREMLVAIEDKGYPIFLHPHYGVGNEHFYDTGHALFLALGFPMETTVCVSRMITTGALDSLPNLKLLVAHAGAALPSLIGRLDSCVEHDHTIANRLLHKPTDYLKKMHFDAISYSVPAMKHLIEIVGDDRIMFGTDNPFFPPMDVSEEERCSAEWPSTTKVWTTLDALGNDTRNKIVSGNAEKLFGKW
jgi:predicted TIM-barrel fold metal-dependent hydrolase